MGSIEKTNSLADGFGQIETWPVERLIEYARNRHAPALGRPYRTDSGVIDVTPMEAAELAAQTLENYLAVSGCEEDADIEGCLLAILGAACGALGALRGDNHALETLKRMVAALENWPSEERSSTRH